MSSDVISAVSGTAISYIETVDTADSVYYLSQINHNVNILIYLFSVSIGLLFGALICYVMYKIIDFCMS